MNDRGENKVGMSKLGANVFTYATSGKGKVQAEQHGTLFEVEESLDSVTMICGSFTSRLTPPGVNDQIIAKQAVRPPRDCDEEPNKGPEAQYTQQGLPLVSNEVSNKEYDK